MTAREQYAEVLAERLMRKHFGRDLKRMRKQKSPGLAAWQEFYEAEAAEHADALAAALPDPEQAVREALLAMADEIDRGPTFPLPPSVIAQLIRERTEDRP